MRQNRFIILLLNGSSMDYFKTYNIWQMEKTLYNQSHNTSKVVIYPQKISNSEQGFKSENGDINILFSLANY